jgi:hypothetical protein
VGRCLSKVEFRSGRSQEQEDERQVRLMKLEKYNPINKNNQVS